MIIQEWDIPLEPTVWINDRPGIWRTRIFGEEKIVIGGIDCYFGGIPQNMTKIIRSIIDGLYEMHPVGTNAELDDPFNAGCFYFNPEDGHIFVNLRSSDGGAFQVPWNKYLKVGVVIGFSSAVDSKRTDRAYYNDILYSPRIIKLPTISIKRDNLTYGVLRKSETTWTFGNADGFFDSKDMIGAITRTYWLDEGDEISDGVLIDSGFITKQTNDTSETTISIGTKRELLNVKIPVEMVTRETYPTAPEDNIGKIIPIVYNRIERAEPVQIAEETLNGRIFSTFKFCLVDNSSTGTEAVRKPCDVSDIWYEVTNDETNEIEIHSVLIDCMIDYSTGTFRVGADIVTDESLFISFTGWHRSSSDTNMGMNLTGLEIIIDILDYAAKCRYRDYNYDLERIINENEKLKRAGRKVFIRIDNDTTKTFDLFGNICRDTDTSFNELGDGRFSAKVDYEAGDSILRIYKQQLLNRDKIAYATDMSNLITSLRITYGFQSGKTERPIYTDSSREKQISEKFRLLNHQDLDSILIDEASAKNKLTRAYDKASNPATSSTFKIPLTKSNSTLPIIACITAQRDRAGNLALWGITGLEKDLKSRTLTISVSKIADAKYVEAYIQGILHDSRYCNSTYLGHTHSEE